MLTYKLPQMITKGKREKRNSRGNSRHTTIVSEQDIFEIKLWWNWYTTICLQWIQRIVVPMRMILMSSCSFVALITTRFYEWRTKLAGHGNIYVYRIHICISHTNLPCKENSISMRSLHWIFLLQTIVCASKCVQFNSHITWMKIHVMLKRIRNIQCSSEQDCANCSFNSDVQSLKRYTLII